MTLRSKLAFFLSQRYFLIKEAFDSLLIKIEVILNSRSIIYSIRILIIVVALMMGYIHTPKDPGAFSKFDKIEINGKKMDTIINVLN